MTSTQLKEQQELKLKALNEIVVKVETEGNRALTTDENTQYEALVKEIADLDTQIDRAIEFEAIKKRTAELNQPKHQKREQKPAEQKFAERVSFDKIVLSQVDPGKFKLEGAEREMIQEGEREAKGYDLQIKGMAIPSMMVKWNNQSQSRALTVGTTTTGGHTVETEVGALIPFLEPRTRVENLGATFYTGLRGNFDLPVNDAQGSGAWEGEADAGVEIQPTFAKRSLSPKRFGGYTITNKQLLLQSVYGAQGIENFARKNISSLIRQAIDSAAFNGSGSGGQPTGIIPTSGTGSVAGAAALSWTKILDFEKALADANADMGRVAFVLTNAGRHQAKSTPKETGQAIYLWQDGATMTPEGVTAMTGEGTLGGYRAVTSTLLPTNLGAGTDEHAAIFGNWEELIVGQWGGVDLVVDPYSLVRTAQIQIVANIWVDIALMHPASFVTMEGIAV